MKANHNSFFFLVIEHMLFPMAQRYENKKYLTTIFKISKYGGKLFLMVENVKDINIKTNYSVFKCVLGTILFCTSL